MSIAVPFEHSYARLPAPFFARVLPTAAGEPTLLRLNRGLAEQIGLDPDQLSSPEGVAALAGARVFEGSDPIALAYAGHQFGGFVPQLGDGRALLLGEIVAPDGARYDIQLKGSGRTPFSRSGDGRAAIGPVLREYIVAEAMFAMGIPTTRALAAVLSGGVVQRETQLPGAVLTRVAASHIRVGTFQYFAARRELENVRILADYTLARHFPDALESGRPYRALLDRVIAGQAELIARWMLVGFIHGVMNTDNTSIACETIDYGPCAFMDAYDPQTVFSSIDRYGRYAFGNQPAIGQWNLTRFAETLLPLLDEDENRAVADAEEALSAFASAFETALNSGFRAKLGLFTQREGDEALVRDLLSLMADNGADFTLTFRGLAGLIEGSDEVKSQFVDTAGLEAWIARWRHRLEEEPPAPQRAAVMNRTNPLFIPRNHLVERVIRAATDGDLAPLDELLAVTARPFDEQPGRTDYSLPPKPEERVLATFCGT